MFENKKLKNWSKNYWNSIKRNIGLISISEQEILRITPITIFGVGGLGGPLADQLVRSGCENITICDNDIFDETNLNRQVCYKEDLGKLKIDVVEILLKKINPEIKVRKYLEVNTKNIKNVLKNSSIVALTLDDPITSILISRECLSMGIPMIESWGIPFLCAWWFNTFSIDYETCYGFNTHEINIEELNKSEKVLLDLKQNLLNTLLMFPNIRSVYDRESGSLEGMISGELPFVSLAPIVRITASYLAFEIIFSGILKIRKMVLAPKIIGYDYFQMKPIEFDLI